MYGPLSFQINAHLCRYLTGEISLIEFQEWFIPSTWNVEHSQDPYAVELAANIHLLLAEFSNGDWTEEELRAKLAPLTIRYTVGAGTAPKTGTSSAIIPSSGEGSWSAFDIQYVKAS